MHQTPTVANVALDVLDSLREGCQVIGFDFTYLYVNDAVARQSQKKREELLGRTMSECFPGIEHSAMYAELARCMRDRAHHRMDNEFPLPNGGVGYFQLQFVPVPEGVCILSVDVTRQRRLQEQLEQHSKMQAIGRLAAGVAHDFNNMLSVIVSYASLLEQQLAGSPGAADANEIVKAGERATELTRQLLAVSRQQVAQPRVVDLRDTITSMDKMLRRLLGAAVSLKTVTPRELYSVKIDPSQIEQVVLNLAVNARDAMSGAGKLTIELANVELDEAYAAEHLGTAQGPHVMLAVSDTGCGIDKATQAKIFEPFFTTKPAGQGTGLGLATVFGIAQQNGGSIWVYSEVGKGTTFKVYFPAATTAEPEELRSAVPLETSRGAGQVILVVEDDEQLRRLSRTILERHGYEVLTAAAPDEAMDAVRADSENGRRIALLLSDVMLPGMNGRELAELVADARPDIRVLYMSGYTGDAATHQGLLTHGAKLVQKPMTANVLLGAVREALT